MDISHKHTLSHVDSYIETLEVFFFHFDSTQTLYLFCPMGDCLRRLDCTVKPVLSGLYTDISLRKTETFLPMSFVKLTLIK